MQWKEGKKKLAVLLSAALVLSLIPTSAFTALAEAWSGTWEQGTPWLKDVKMKVTGKSTIEIGETTTIQVSAGYEASPADANPGVATPSGVDDVLEKLGMGNVEQTSDNSGKVSIESVGPNGIITVKGVAGGTVTLTLKGIKGVSCEITVDPSNADAVEAAKNAIEGGTYTVKQEGAGDVSALKTALEEQINKLSEVQGKGFETVEVTIVGDSFNAAQKGDGDTPNGTNGSFRFTVTLTKGMSSQTTKQKDGTIEATKFDGTPNAKIVETAKIAIENGTYTVKQEVAGDEEALKKALEEQINKLSEVQGKEFDTVEVTIIGDSFNAAQKGDGDTPKGTNGSFKFTVTLTKGKASQTTEQKDGTIEATEFDGTPNAEIVETAKTAIENDNYTFKQEDVGNEAALKNALEKQIQELPEVQGKGLETVEVTIVSGSFNAAQKGDADNSEGTNGSFKFIVTLTKGKTTKTTTEKNGIIEATQFIGTTNAEAVAAAKSAIEGGTYTVEQKDAGDENALKTVLAAQINALSGMSGTEIEVKAGDITVSGFKAAAAGTADNLKGTNGSFTFTVKLSKGKTTEETVSMTGEITAVPFIVTSLALPGKVTIDLAEKLEAEVTVTPQMTGTPTEEQKKAIAQDFRDGKFKAELICTGQHCAQILKTTVNDDGPTVSLTIEGLAHDSATLKVSYGALTASCTVVVTEPEGTTIVGAEVPKVNLDSVNAETLEGQLKEDSEEEVPANADAQISAILDTIASSNLPFEAINQSVEAMLKKEKSNAGVIILKPTVEVKDLELDIDGGTVVVKSMDAELNVEIDIDGQILDEEAAKQLLKDNGIYISMSVAVPERAARGGADYVQWTHYTDSGTEDNSVLEDEVTRISTDNIATVRARSFSPFKLEFVMSDNESAYSSDSDSGSSVVLVGQWLRAEDGVRWWYRYPDGTWPAGGWAELVWNGKLDWYYFDEKGYMVTGWVTDGGLRYYLHPISDGTQGYMYTGWHLIDGKYYYFSNISDGTRGHLLVNTTTPDGAVVGADGARIQ